jgi:hypothetical protein
MKILADRWQLGRLFKVNPWTIAGPWLHEGLVDARVQRGRAGQPALFDGARAVAWFNREKARTLGEHKTMREDLHAVLREDRQSRRPAAAPRPTPTLERRLP